MRETKANQFGILGFGATTMTTIPPSSKARPPICSAASSPPGVELRTKPSNPGIAKEGDAWDLFAAYFLNKNLSLTVAYADLGNIVIKDDQHGAYLSLQAGF